MPGEIALINEHFPMPQLERPLFKNQNFSLTDYGAAGVGTTKNTDAFCQAIAACNAAGGARSSFHQASG